MNYKSGDMWSAYDGVNPWLFTGNSYVKSNGHLVMGRGLALQVKQRYPRLPEFFGGNITYHSQQLGDYYIILDPTTMIGVVQVKRHFKNQADLALIKYSIFQLATWAKNYPDYSFNVNFPGIGNGRLSVAQVEPLLEPLPDNVNVWRYATPGGRQ